MIEPTIETQQTYDLIAPEYARRNSTIDPRLVLDLGSLTASLPQGGLVVDVGCGPGREVALLREQGFRAVGLDLSIGQLRTGGLSGVAQADMRHLPLKTDVADAIWCQAALLHIPRHALPTVLNEFARVVRAGGQLYLAVAEGDGEDWEIASKYGSTRRRWFTYHQEPDLTVQLFAAGFEVRQVRRVRAGRDWLALHSRRFTRKTADESC